MFSLFFLFSGDSELLGEHLFSDEEQQVWGRTFPSMLCKARLQLDSEQPVPTSNQTGRERERWREGLRERERERV